jgi:hypothetical protein
MEMREIESSVSSFGITSKLITDRKDIKSLAMLIAKEQDVVFSNADLHKFYFENIMWSAAELEAKKTGLDPKTLEISGSSLPMYYMISNWDFLQSISALRPSSYITSAHASIYATAAAIGAITIDSERPQDFIIAGRAFERLWLTVTKLGLNLEPLLGIPFLKLGIENNPTALNTSQTEIIESGYKEINRMFVFDGKRVAALFRVGGGTPSQYHSVRKDLSAVVTAL